MPKIWHGLENLLLIVALAAMVALPLIDAVSGRFFRAGISSAAPLTQHLVLIVAMVGGAVAARQNRLLSLSAISELLAPRWKPLAHVLAHGTAAAFAALLFVASWQYWETENGSKIAGIPLQWLLLTMPAGFVLIAIRLILHAADKIAPRLIAAAIAALVFAGVWFMPQGSNGVLVAALCLLVIVGLMGMPIFSLLGGAALMLFRASDEPVAAISISHYDMVVNPTLPALPLFTLAGCFLAEGGTSKRLVRVFQGIVGHLRGGAGIMTVLVCAFFTSFTGASGVTILALGGLLMPVLLANRFSERTSLGMLTGAGSLGLLFPPCLPPILYAIIASNVGIHQGVTVRIEEMYLGGILPGLLLVALAMAWVILQQPKGVSETKKFSAKEAWAAIWVAKWELLLPVVAVVSLLSGLATPVQASAITALYAFVVETFVYRDLKLFKDGPRVLIESGLLMGGVLLILGVAMGLTNYLITAQVPDNMVDWAKHYIKHPWVFLLALNVFLLGVGCLMEIYPAIIVAVPLILPVGLSFGIDPVHLGVIFLSNMELGFLTPLVGVNVLMGAYRFNKPVGEVARSVLPMLAVFALGVLLITYFPPLTTALPRWFGHHH